MVKKIIYLILLIIVVSITYSNHFYNDFQYDDSIAIQTNIYIKNLSNIPHFFTDPSTYVYIHRYRPVALTTFAIDYYMGNGLNPFYFHLDMFFWFLVQLVIMFFLFSEILKKTIHHPWADLFSIIAVAWYGLHTANAETINYISARVDSLSTLSVVASLYLYVVFPKKRNYLFYLLPVSVGLLIKEQTIMFAPIIFVYVLLFESNKSLFDLLNKGGLRLMKDVFSKTFPAFLVCLAMGIVVVVMQTKTYSPVGIPVYNYFITQPWVILRYFLLFFLPVNLSPNTDWKAFDSIFDERAIIGFIFIISLVYLSFRASKIPSTRPVAFGVIWFILSLLPTSSFIPIPEVTTDYRMFFPFVGLTLAVVWAIGIQIIKIEPLIKKNLIIKILLSLGLIAILGLNINGVRKRNLVWKTNESLWYDVTVRSPQNGRGLMNYGVIQMGKGNLEVALDYFERAQIYWPYYPYLHINLGIVKNALYGPQDAEKYFKNSINYGPEVNVAYYYYAEFLMNHERNQEAVYYAEYSLSLDSSHLQTRHLLMNLYQRLSENEKLKNILSETLKIYPQDELSLNYSKN